MIEGRKQIQERLERLYPGERGTKKYAEYCYKQKKLVVFMLLFAIGVGVISSLYGFRNRKIQEGNSLPRKEWGEGDYEVTLSAKVGETKEKITYVVEERQYTEEELNRLSLAAKEELSRKIPGQNTNLLCIRNSIVLPANLPEYPFAISWKSSNYQRVRTDGSVNTKEISVQGEEVILTAILSCQGNTFEHEFGIRLYPELTDKEEQQRNELVQLLSESDENSKQQEKIQLPMMLGEDNIIWEEQAEQKIVQVVLAGLAGAGILIWGMNRDLIKKDEQRRFQLAVQYPEFVSSLQLYLEAGLSLRNTFFRIRNNYRKQNKPDKGKNYLYEEVSIACNRLANGIPESEVYKNWAKRCDEVHYRKLGYLLVSYTRQGNSDIIKHLSEEVYAAWEERRNSVKKQGEEAGTKLLFPMAVMLLVVMSLIIMPVYVSF